MTIRVQLFATLSGYLPDHAEGDTATVTVSAGARALDVLRLLNIPPAVPCLIVVNGRDAEPDQPLAEGDTVTLFPPLAGG